MKKIFEKKEIENVKKVKETALTTKEEDNEGLIINIKSSIMIEDLVRMQEENNPFLPYAYISNKKTPNDPPYVLVIKATNNIYPEAPYTVNWLAIRPMVRVLEGERYTERAYASFYENQEGETAGAYERLLKESKEDSNIQVGRCLLLVFTWKQDEETRAKICTFETFKSMQDYWTAPLAETSLHDRKTCEVLITNHEQNMVTSKTNHDYLASWNFKQWKIRDMTMEENKAIKETFQKQEKAVQTFLKK